MANDLVQSWGDARVIEWAVSVIPSKYRTQSTEDAVRRMLEDVVGEVLLLWDRETLRDSRGDVPLKVLTFIEYGLDQLKRSHADSKGLCSVTPSSGAISEFQCLATEAIVRSLAGHAQERSPRWLGVSHCGLVLEILQSIELKQLLPKQFSWLEEGLGMQLVSDNLVLFEVLGSTSCLVDGIHRLQNLKNIALQQNRHAARKVFLVAVVPKSNGKAPIAKNTLDSHVHIAATNEDVLRSAHESKEVVTEIVNNRRPGRSWLARPHPVPPKLEARAVREIVAQLSRPGKKGGYVWIKHWGARYAGLGRPSDFLKKHPERFEMLMKDERRYRVKLVSQEQLKCCDPVLEGRALRDITEQLQRPIKSSGSCIWIKVADSRPSDTEKACLTMKSEVKGQSPCGPSATLTKWHAKVPKLLSPEVFTDVRSRKRWYRAKLSQTKLQQQQHQQLQQQRNEVLA